MSKLLLLLLWKKKKKTWKHERWLATPPWSSLTSSLLVQFLLVKNCYIVFYSKRTKGNFFNTFYRATMVQKSTMKSVTSRWHVATAPTCTAIHCQSECVTLAHRRIFLLRTNPFCASFFFSLRKPLHFQNFLRLIHCERLHYCNITSSFVIFCTFYCQQFIFF